MSRNRPTNTLIISRDIHQHKHRKSSLSPKAKFTKKNSHTHTNRHTNTHTQTHRQIIKPKKQKPTLTVEKNLQKFTHTNSKIHSPTRTKVRVKITQKHRYPYSENSHRHRHTHTHSEKHKYTHKHSVTHIYNHKSHTHKQT